MPAQQSDLLILDTPEEQKTAIKRGGEFSLDVTGINDWLLARQKLKIPQKVVFFRLLATMVNAGLPVLKSINILRKQEKDPLLQKLYERLLAEIRAGKNLSTALREYKGNFSDSECSIIEAGEKTGKLNNSLVQLADQVEKISSISKKLKGALVYPIAIIIVMLGAIMVLMTLVVPKIVEIFGDPEELPALTKALIATSDFFVGYWWAIIVGLVVFVIGIMIWRQTKDGKYRYDGLILRVPIF